jgi:hypothetical protein
MRVFGWRGSAFFWGWTGWKLLMQCGPGRTIRNDPVHLVALPSWASANSVSHPAAHGRRDSVVSGNLLARVTDWAFPGRAVLLNGPSGGLDGTSGPMGRDCARYPVEAVPQVICVTGQVRGGPMNRQQSHFESAECDC